MELYEALEKRRTCRDYSDREVSDEILKRVIGAAFKAPTNDHLRQLEFVVVRGRENIAPILDPLAKNMAAFKKLVHEADESGDKDKMAMFADALPEPVKGYQFRPTTAAKSFDYAEVCEAKHREALELLFSKADRVSYSSLIGRLQSSYAAIGHSFGINKAKQLKVFLENKRMIVKEDKFYRYNPEFHY